MMACMLGDFYAVRCNTVSGGYNILMHAGGPISHDYEGRIEVFTDGACVRNGRQGARGGCGIWFGEGHIDNEGSPLGFYDHDPDSNQTNNRAELMAAWIGLDQAIKMIRYPWRVRLFTDSKYIFNGLTEYIYKWECNGWKTSRGELVKNKDLWKKLREISSQFDQCVIQWVPRMHPLLQKADKLAKEGANKPYFV